MRLIELNLELAKQQLLRRSAHGRVPRIMSLGFAPLDCDGHVFAVRAQFSFGPDYATEIVFDLPGRHGG